MRKDLTVITMNIIKTDWKWNGTLSSRASTEYIALHHAEAVKCTAKQVDEWHKANGWAGIGYHFFVGKDGSVYEGRPLWATGAHVFGKNDISVGVCVEGDYHNKDKVMPSTQKNTVKAVIAYLKAMYPKAEIVGHGEIGASNCPGKYYPLEEMKNYNKEDDVMTAEERAEIDALELRVKALENPMIYNYIDDNMPEWAREAVSAAIAKGAVLGEGEGLGLTYSDLRAIVREYRLGLYN